MVAHGTEAVTAVQAQVEDAQVVSKVPKFQSYQVPRSTGIFCSNNNRKDTFRNLGNLVPTYRVQSTVPRFQRIPIAYLLTTVHGTRYMAHSTQ